MDAALTSAKAADAANSQPSADAARCALSGLRISLGTGAAAGTVLTRYPLDFTNVSGAPCTLAGYPQVTAYRGDGVQVGAAAGRDRSIAAHRILLAPGQSAHATLDAALPAGRCGPVRVTGLRVVAPGQTAARYVRRPLTACTVLAPQGQDYLRVRAVQPGQGHSPVAGVAGSGAGSAPAVTRSTAPASARSAGPAHPAKTASRHTSEPD
jgi:hypothetical protein